MDKNAIVLKAKDFCKKHNISNYPINIVELCAHYGIKVFEQYLPGDVSGFIVVQKENFSNYDTNKLIVVNLSDSARRRRFTIAHELAHYILHCDSKEIYAHRDVGQNRGIETEANIFASNILMPEQLVRQALSRLEDEVWGEIPSHLKSDYIADLFAVSFAAAQVRLEQLKLS